MTPGPDTVVLRRTALRLGLQASVIVALIVVLLTGVAMIVVLTGQGTTADQMLADTVATADDVSDPPTGMWLTIREQGRDETSQGMPVGLPDLAALDRVAGGGMELTDVDIPAGHFRVRTESVHGNIVQAVLDLHADRMADMRLVGALFMVGVVGLGLAAVTGFWLGRRAVRPLADLLAQRRHFVADASHELRTPLTLLSTRAQLLYRKVSGTAVTAEVDGLVRDSKYLSQILDDLLTTLDPRTAMDELIDLVSVVDDRVEAVRPAANGIRLNWVKPTRPARVTGSAAALRRAVTALLDNAIRHAQSTVDISVTVTGDTVRLRITDDGPGIAEDVLPQLFTRFGSFSTTAGGRQGHGLGLALVAEIAQRHRGSVKAANSGAGGAELLLSLPRTT